MTSSNTKGRNMKVAAQRGFTLIEILIAAVIVAVGLLSVSSLQTQLVRQSGENTARAEAMALAQARIEEMRNYTDTISTKDQFDAVFATTAGFTNGVTIDGDNATFTRAESILAGGQTKQVDVRVGWTDRVGVDQNVVLSTQVGWESPRAAGDLARSDMDPLVASPAGRATLGEGLLPVGTPTTPNGDGTSIYVDGPDQKLVVDGAIVLTLPDSCDTTGTCLAFSKISGRIYIDTATQSSLAPGEVQVLATDSAYCNRYYVGPSGNATVVTNSTRNVLTTANGDYEYFDYTCYIGGGWYGNIGILLDGGLSQNDKVCQGDPVSTNAWMRPVIGARRAYRGMLYKVDAGTASGKEENASGDPIYYSTGLGEETVLPDPTSTTWVSGASYSSGARVVYDNYVYQAKTTHSGIAVTPNIDTSRWALLGSKKTHDFVISSMPTGATDGSNCVTRGVMVRADSNLNGTPGDRFEDMPTDFFCLNPAYVDAFSSPFEVGDSCPYNPTAGTPTRHVISGTIVAEPASADLESLLASSVDLIGVNTSDGLGNCTRGSFVGTASLLAATFTCEVYEWGGGWSGYIQISPNSSNMICTDSGLDGAVDDRLHLSGIAGDTLGRDFHCVAGNVTTIEGTVTTVNANKTLNSATISATNGWCSVATDGLSYQCVTGIYSTDTWSGTITFTSDGFVCGANVNASTGVATLNAIAPGAYTLNLGIVNNSGSTCPQ